jgi:hypothetical protein
MSRCFRGKRRRLLYLSTGSTEQYGIAEKKRRRTVGDMNSSRAQSNLYRRIKRIASDFHLSQEPMAEKALAALYCPLLLVHRVPWSQSQSPVLRPRGPAGSGLRLRPPAIGEAVCADEED